jgi:nitrite reductase (NO-forming)
MDAAVKPLVSDPVKEIRLDTTHKIIEIAPGVNSVAGPSATRFQRRLSGSRRRSHQVLDDQPQRRARAGHAAYGGTHDAFDGLSRGDGVTARQVSLGRAGQTISFEFTANYPASSCTTAARRWCSSILRQGMYGMVIVEPRNGYPTKVDREYAIVQSEFYTKPDPQKRKVDGQPLYVLDGDRLRTKAPTYTVFNGRYNGMVDKPLPAQAGERVRLFVLNVGPSNTSSFHVVGTIFDRVWMEGNPENQWRGAQTVLLGSSNARSWSSSFPKLAATSWSTTISPTHRRAQSD